MNILALFLEVSDKIPTVAQMYLTGLFWAIVILITTYINRWLGLAFLLVALLFSIETITDGLGADIMDAVIKEMGESYVRHWNYSIVSSVALELFAFGSAVILKNYYRRTKVKLK